MSAAFATAEPRRIKATHRRRRKIASGRFVQRYYDPAIGRFLSVDPVAANSGTGFNRYSYASNNPYVFTDPDGRTALAKELTQSVSTGVKIAKEQVVETAKTLKADFDTGLAAVANSPVTEGVAGGVEVVGGAAMVVTGVVDLIFTAAVGGDGPETAPAAGLVVTGSIAMSDGMISIGNAVNGTNNRTTLGQLGEKVAGPDGGRLGDAASMVIGVQGAKSAAIDALKTGNSASAVSAASSAYGVGSTADNQRKQ